MSRHQNCTESWWETLRRAYTVWYHYDPVNFFWNSHKRHPIACPVGWAMGFLLWAQTLIYILPLSLHWCMQYHIILYHVITASNCNLMLSSKSPPLWEIMELCWSKASNYLWELSKLWINLPGDETGWYKDCWFPGPRLNIKTVLSTYGDFHVKDKTAVRTSYL